MTRDKLNKIVSVCNERNLPKEHTLFMTTSEYKSLNRWFCDLLPISAEHKSKISINVFQYAGYKFNIAIIV